MVSVTTDRKQTAKTQENSEFSPEHRVGKHYASTALEMAARGGFIGLGIVYGVVGLLALLTVLNGGQQDGPEGLPPLPYQAISWSGR